MKKWMISFVIMLILTLLVEGGCMILAYNPNLSDAFDNAFGGEFMFRDNPKGLLQFALLNSITAIPLGTIMLRGVIWLLENDPIIKRYEQEEKEQENDK